MNLLDWGTDPDSAPSGLASLLQAIPQAAQGSPPPLDPITDQMADPQTKAWAAQMYERQRQAQLAAVAHNGGSLAEAMAPSTAADQGYVGDVRNAIVQAMMLRTYRNAAQQQAAQQAQPQSQPSGPMAAFDAASYGMPQNVPQPALSPEMSRLAASGFLPPQLLKNATDAHALDMERYKSSVTQAQLAATPLLNKLKTAASSPQAAALVSNDQLLGSAWTQVAPQLGLNPYQDLNQKNAQRVAAYLHDKLASGLQLTPIGQPTTYTQQRNALGRVVNVNDTTGEAKEGAGEVGTQEVSDTDPNTGLPLLRLDTKAHAVTSGKQPFNMDVFAANMVSDPKTLENTYQYAKLHGGALPPGLANRNPVATAASLHYISQRSAAEGNTQLAMAAKEQEVKASNSVYSAYVDGKSQPSVQLNSINTAVKHIGTLRPLIDLNGNTDTPLWNKAQNMFKEQTGSAAPTNLAQMKEFVSGEVAKAVLPMGGGEAERERLTAPLNEANSYEQLQGAVSIIERALAGKTDALRNGWNVGTQGMHGSFDKLLLPETRAALGRPAPAAAHPPSVQAILDKYPPKAP